MLDSANIQMNRDDSEFEDLEDFITVFSFPPPFAIPIPFVSLL